MFIDTRLFFPLRQIYATGKSTLSLSSKPLIKYMREQAVAEILWLQNRYRICVHLNEIRDRLEVGR